jgi:hypothetical protein
MNPGFSLVCNLNQCTLQSKFTHWVREESCRNTSAIFKTKTISQPQICLFPSFNLSYKPGSNTCFWYRLNHTGMCWRVSLVQSECAAGSYQGVCCRVNVSQGLTSAKWMCCRVNVLQGITSAEWVCCRDSINNVLQSECVAGYHQWTCCRVSVLQGPNKECVAEWVCCRDPIKNVLQSECVAESHQCRVSVLQGPIKECVAEWMCCRVSPRNVLQSECVAGTQ